MADRDRDPATTGPSPQEPHSDQAAEPNALGDRLKQLQGSYRSWAETHHVQYFGTDTSTPGQADDDRAPRPPSDIEVTPTQSPSATAVAPGALPRASVPSPAPGSSRGPVPLLAPAVGSGDGLQQRSEPLEAVTSPSGDGAPTAAGIAPPMTRPPAAESSELATAQTEPAATPNQLPTPAPPIASLAIRPPAAETRELAAAQTEPAAAPIQLPTPAPPIELPQTKENAEEAAAKQAKPEGTTAQDAKPRARPDLTSRTRDVDFRQALTKGLSAARSNLLTVFLFSQLLNALLLAMPIYLFQVSDRVLTSRSIETLIMLSIIVLGALLAHALLDVCRRIILMRVATDVECKLGAPVLAAAAKASQAGSSREFQTLGDLQHLRAFLTGPVVLTMMDAPITPLFLAAVFLIHWQLGVIVAVSGIVLLTIAWFNQRATAVPFSHAQAYAVRANLQTEAMARNAQAMNAMGMIPEGVRMWGRDTAESLKSQTRAQDRNVWFTGLSKFVRLVTQIMILGWGAWLALNGQLTGGMIIAASIVASRALVPLEGTIEGWNGFVQARAAYGRIRALLQSSALNFERLRLPRPVGKLSVERLLYVPPPTKKVILNGVTFELNPGDSLAIVGASGTGKSTLARMLVGSITPTAGNVRLDSMDLRNWDPRQFGESVGYLPQDVQLFPASIKANIARMREDADDEAIFDAAELADVHEMIAQFPQGYETMINADGSPLSGGQKQRIGLARAFFGSPRLVVLDEPNSNLDVTGERALAQAMQRAKTKGMTIVAITQRPSLLNSVDKIMILKDGTIQAIGPREQMLAILNGRQQAPSTPRPTLEPVLEG